MSTYTALALGGIVPAILLTLLFRALIGKLFKGLSGGLRLGIGAAIAYLTCIILYGYGAAADGFPPLFRAAAEIYAPGIIIAVSLLALLAARKPKAEDAF